MKIITRMQTRFMRRSKDCGICLTTVSFQGKLDCCTHVFCMECIRSWSEIENTCPVCKARFNSITRAPCRLEYRASKRRKEVIHVTHKNQSQTISHSDMMQILELAERMVQHEVGRLFQRLSSIDLRRLRRILSRYSLNR